MAAPITLRVDEETRRRIIQLANRRQVSTSQLIREAIEAWVEKHEAIATPYESAADLVGVVHGRKRKRSAQTGRHFKQILKNRRQGL